MGLAGTWNPAEVGPENIRKAIAAFETALEAGITFYDHADIYGGTGCETIFKDCLAAVPGSREKIYIATKVGIRAGYYEHEPDYIRQSIEGSLEPHGHGLCRSLSAPPPGPADASGARRPRCWTNWWSRARCEAIGVSNYYPHQTLALQRYLKVPIVSNQISLSLLRLDPDLRGGGGTAEATACWTSAWSSASCRWPTARSAAAGSPAGAKCPPTIPAASASSAC